MDVYEFLRINITRKFSIWKESGIGYSMSVSMGLCTGNLLPVEHSYRKNATIWFPYNLSWNHGDCEHWMKLYNYIFAKWRHILQVGLKTSFKHLDNCQNCLKSQYKLIIYIWAVTKKCGFVKDINVSIFIGLYRSIICGGNSIIWLIHVYLHLVQWIMDLMYVSRYVRTRL